MVVRSALSTLIMTVERSDLASGCVRDILLKWADKAGIASESEANACLKRPVRG